MAKMKILRHFRFIAIFLALALVGCATTLPVRNVSNAPVVTGKANPTMDEVRDAIKRAGAGLGWGMKENSPGSITGTLHLRTHTAVVDIKYDTKSYSIDYADSVDLKYDSTKKTIHKNYNAWVQNLDNGIKTNLTNI